ncbi:hypothetical protein [unidentified bacterial endosymbiont]|uniref:hypothetical protein n=1 Tax=unidentified bacterial endosymbiont TaxID=2355 RepID=UPI00209F5EA9|nr:hypothetical protein [unidentified bacterial endosymbiont]
MSHTKASSSSNVSPSNIQIHETDKNATIRIIDNSIDYFVKTKKDIENIKEIDSITETLESKLLNRELKIETSVQKELASRASIGKNDKSKAECLIKDSQNQLTRIIIFKNGKFEICKKLDELKKVQDELLKAINKTLLTRIEKYITKCSKENIKTIKENLKAISSDFERLTIKCVESEAIKITDFFNKKEQDFKENIDKLIAILPDSDTVIKKALTDYCEILNAFKSNGVWDNLIDCNQSSSRYLAYANKCINKNQTDSKKNPEPPVGQDQNLIEQINASTTVNAPSTTVNDPSPLISDPPYDPGSIFKF